MAEFCDINVDTTLFTYYLVGTIESIHQWLLKLDTTIDSLT